MIKFVWKVYGLINLMVLKGLQSCENLSFWFEIATFIELPDINRKWIWRNLSVSLAGSNALRTVGCGFIERKPTAVSLCGPDVLKTIKSLENTFYYLTVSKLSSNSFLFRRYVWKVYIFKNHIVLKVIERGEIFNFLSKIVTFSL